MSSICIVDDNRPTLVRLSRAFGAAGFDNVMTESDPLIAMSRIRQNCPDVLIVDYNMPQLNGLAMVEMLKREGIVPHLPAVLLSGLDLSELSERDAGQGLHHSRMWHAALERVQFGPVPVVAAVNGVAAGAGANVALACDLVVAKASASFIAAQPPFRRDPAACLPDRIVP